MKVVVDFEVCQSHGLCTQAAPEVFEIRDDGFLYILQENPPEALRKDSSKAIPQLYGALLKHEQDVHMFERLAFMQRRQGH